MTMILLEYNYSCINSVFLTLMMYPVKVTTLHAILIITLNVLNLTVEFKLLNRLLT